MQNTMFQNKLQVGLLLFLMLLLIGIRACESTFFYDPLLAYFKGDFQNQPFPKLDYFNYILHVFLRYFINSLLSIGIIYLLFKERQLIRFVSFLYAGIGAVMLIVFSVVIVYFAETHKNELFYLRRFLIQPLFLMIFIPALYYQKKIKVQQKVV
jgi:exosortase F-associated protein